MNIIETIKASPVYKQIIADSFGGIMYNVANRDKYEAEAIQALWYSMPAVERERAGGIIKGAFNFLKGDEE